jgi:hypothetical protein
MRKGGNGNYRHYQHQPINLREQPRAAAKRGYGCVIPQGESDFYITSPACLLRRQNKQREGLCHERKHSHPITHTCCRRGSAKIAPIFDLAAEIDFSSAQKWQN